MIRLSKPAQTSDSRIFIAPKRASCGMPYEYHNCMRMDGIEKSFGEITPIYCPNPIRTGEFIEVDQIAGADSRWTTNLSGRLPMEYQSIIQTMALSRCAFDIQVHFGKCIDPSNFNQFTMGWIFENVGISSYSLGPMGALTPDERGVIDETVAISAERAYQIFKNYPIEFGQELTDDGPVISMTYGALQNCVQSCDRCTHFYGLKLPATPLGSQDIYIIWTEDGGLTWQQVPLACSAALLSSPLQTYHIATDGTFLYITLDETGGPGHLYIVNIQNMIDNLSGIASFYLNTGQSIWDTAMLGNQLWTVGPLGQIGIFDKNTFVYTILPNFTPINLYSIHGLDSDNVLVGGINGTLAVKLNGGSFKLVAFTVSGVPVVENITALQMKTQTEWLVGTEAGKVYCTFNGGLSFNLIGAFVGCIDEISFSTNNVGYLITRFPGQIWRTFDAGATWIQVEDKFLQVPVGVELHALATCPENPNTFVIGGRIPDVPVLNPCDPNLIYADGNTGVILVGRLQ